MGQDAAPGDVPSASGPATDPSLGRVLEYPRGGPTILRLVLGAQLRRLREERQISTEQAGYAIRASHSKISRMELGRVGCKARDVADLLTLYGVSDADERAAMLELAERAGRPDWWHKYTDVLPSWFEAYITLESAATLIRAYEVQFVPGLLQTEEYARAVIRLGHFDATPEEVERRVTMRLTRQHCLRQTEAPRLWAVVDEAVLRRPVGGRTVMRAQIAHLIEMLELGNVSLQIVPFAAGGHASAGTPFTVLRFAEQALADVVYLEQLSSALYLDKPVDVERYLRTMDRLCAAGTRPEETAGRLATILNET